MAIKRGIDRNERMLLPECVEDYVGEENPVRVIDAFIQGLDLSKLGIEERLENSIGPGHYDRRCLLKLYLYGYLNRIYSSRELEKATHRNLEVIWLMGKLQPDHWTINEFRKSNSKALKGLFKRFHLICGKLDLFGKDLVAIDSAFFKGSNSAGKNHTQNKLAKRLQRIEEHIDNYLKQLESNESKNTGAITGSAIKEQIKELEQKREKVEKLLEQANNSKSGQLSEVDPDARSLQKRGEKVVGYHLQIAVDDKHHLIVNNQMGKSGTDSDQLLPMALQSKEVLAVEHLNVVADAGYYNIDAMRQCDQNSITVTVPIRKSRSGIFDREKFKHDESKDVLICPQGKELLRHKNTYYPKSKLSYKTYHNAKACLGCELLKQCTKGKFRRVQILEPEPVIDKLKERLKNQPELLGKRSAVVEHPFASMKFWMGAYAVKTRGWEKVGAELSMTCLAYNFKRVLNIVGVEKMLQAMNTAACFC